MRSDPRTMKGPLHRLSPTVALVIANIVVYIYTGLIGNDFIFTASSVLKTYGQHSYAVFYAGWWWQLFTSMFVHVSIAHLASNLLFLLIFGLRAEDLFTSWEYYLVYFASGISGNVLSLLYILYPYPVTSAGASGAIFGLFGAVIIYMRKVVGGSVVGAILFAFLFFFITLSTGINIYAHFGGLFVGLVMGYWLAKNRKIQYTYRISY
jgi:rhomboid protease GluP